MPYPPQPPRVELSSQEVQLLPGSIWNWNPTILTGIRSYVLPAHRWHIFGIALFKKYIYNIEYTEGIQIPQICIIWMAKVFPIVQCFDFLKSFAHLPLRSIFRKSHLCSNVQIPDTVLRFWNHCSLMLGSHLANLHKCTKSLHDKYQVGPVWRPSVGKDVSLQRRTSMDCFQPLEVHGIIRDYLIQGLIIL